MNNLLDIYLRDISRYQPITLEQEQILAQAARQGDAEAREQLIHAHLSLVVRIAKVYMPPCDEILDLIQEGNIGLIRAVDKFDPHRGSRFSTVAVYWIKKYMLIYLRKEQDDSLSLDMEITDGSEVLLLSDTIADKATIFGDSCVKHIEEVIEYEELQEKVRKMLATLSPREQEVLKLLYGLDNYPVLSRRDVAHTIGVREEQVSRIKMRVMDGFAYWLMDASLLGNGRFAIG